LRDIMASGANQIELIEASEAIERHSDSLIHQKGLNEAYNEK